MTRIYKGENGETVKQSKRKEGKWQNHVVVKDEKEFWKFDDGEEKEIPKREEREELVDKVHEKIGHRGLETTYYEMKKTWYWPGMKETIKNVIRACEICQKMNRKNPGGEKFIEKSMRLEKIAVDIMKTDDLYVLILIDYFSRMIWTKILINKSAEETKKVMEDRMKERNRPVEMAIDNGKEFCNKEFKKMCWDFGIEHQLVGVEAHRSNGRIKRAIRSIKDMMKKI